MEKVQFQVLLAGLHLLTFLLSSYGIDSTNVVTLKSILIYTTHNWLPIQPTIYFACKGEKNTTTLPDVKVTNVLYTFNGKESWQPLTELPEKKCKRCGVYKLDILKDDVFDEWEFCPADFVNGNYDHFKAKEFNATFRCPSCTASETGVSTSSKSKRGSHGKLKRNIVIILIVGILSSVIAVAGLVGGIRYLQRRKREMDQAKFIQLFQEIDEEEEVDEEHIEIINAV